MGIDVPAAEFLAFARRHEVDFTTTLTIGRQSRFGPGADLVAAMERFAVVADPQDLRRALGATPWADPILSALGATTQAALDVSDFEGAEVLHDLNEPLPGELAGRWSCVVDGGATEHVFKFPTALETTMRLVAPGGHLVTMVPTNQQSGHGFYQVGPEVYFRALVPDNGFVVRGVFLHQAGLRSRWSRLADPADAGHRITLSTAAPAMLYVIAQRVGHAALTATPQQADYAAAWADGEAAVPVTASPRRGSGLRQAVYRRLGPTAGEAARAIRALLRTARGADLPRVDLRDESLAPRSEPGAQAR